MQKSLIEGLLLVTHALVNEGSCILQIYSSIYKLTVEIIYILYNIFEEIYISKPLSSDPRGLVS